MTRQIAHIGILVPDLEAAIEHWSAVLGYTFSPIVRYRTDDYSDHTGAGHFHDARIALSYENPMVELMEFTGEGTHAEKNGVGFHHFGFIDVDDVEGVRDELAAAGLPADGEARLPSGRTHLWFTDPAALGGIRLEYVGTEPSPIVSDTGAELPREDSGWVKVWDEEPAESDAPRIHHFGVMVADIEAARERWSELTGWEFEPIRHYRTDAYVDFSDETPHHHDARTSMSIGDGPRVELMEFTGNGTHGAQLGEGLHHVAFIDHADLAKAREHFAAQGLGVQGAALDEDGSDLLFFTDPAQLDGIRLEIVDLSKPHPIYADDGRRIVFSPTGEEIG
jgi:catechol 2,3-dioxygenase-like lactoylglutathione lyase family enzyme